MEIETPKLFTMTRAGQQTVQGRHNWMLKSTNPKERARRKTRLKIAKASKKRNRS